MKGQVPFGFTAIKGRLIKDKSEQKVIRKINKWSINGSSLREIASRLNEDITPTKNGGKWQANTVKKVLSRISI